MPIRRRCEIENNGNSARLACELSGLLCTRSYQEKFRSRLMGPPVTSSWCRTGWRASSGPQMSSRPWMKGLASIIQTGSIRRPAKGNGGDALSVSSQSGESGPVGQPRPAPSSTKVHRIAGTVTARGTGDPTRFAHSRGSRPSPCRRWARRNAGMLAAWAAGGRPADKAVLETPLPAAPQRKITGAVSRGVEPRNGRLNVFAENAGPAARSLRRMCCSRNRHRAQKRVCSSHGRYGMNRQQEDLAGTSRCSGRPTS